MSTAYERARKAARMRARRRAIAYGTWNPQELTPAAPVVEHIAALRAYGMSLRAIEEIAGGPPGSLADLAYPGHHQHPAQVTPERAEKVLAVRFDLDAIPDHRQVDVSGTRRRIQALARTGWSMRHLAELLGVTVSTVSAYTKPNRKRVLVRVARAVRDVYDELAMTPGDCTRAARWAERRGWPPPLAWDDATIDDPTAQPWVDDSPRGAHVPGHGVVNRDSLTDCASWGLTISEAADRLGVSRDAIEVGITRHAPELRETFARNLAAAEDAVRTPGRRVA